MSQVQMGLGYIDLQARGSAQFVADMSQASKAAGGMSSELGGLSSAAVKVAAPVAAFAAAMKGIETIMKGATIAVTTASGDAENFSKTLYSLGFGVGPAAKSIDDLVFAINDYRSGTTAAAQASKELAQTLEKSFQRGEAAADALSKRVLALSAQTELVRKNMDMSGFQRSQANQGIADQTRAQMEAEVQAQTEAAEQAIKKITDRRKSEGFFFRATQEVAGKNTTKADREQVKQIQSRLEETVKNIRSSGLSVINAAAEFNGAQADQEYLKFREKNKKEIEKIQQDTDQIKLQTAGKTLDAELQAIEIRKKESIEAAKEEFRARGDLNNQLSQKMAAIETKAQVEIEAAKKRQADKDKAEADQKEKEKQEDIKKAEDAYNKASDKVLSDTGKFQDAQKRLEEIVKSQQEETKKFVNVGGRMTGEDLANEIQNTLLQAKDTKFEEQMKVAEEQIELTKKQLETSIESAQTLKEIANAKLGAAFLGE